MANVSQQLEGVFAVAILTAFPELTDPAVAVEASKNDRFGDYQCNSAMVIAQVGFVGGQIGHLWVV